MSMFRVSNFKFSPPKLKLTWPQTSFFQVSNFEVSPPKRSLQCFFASPYQWFSQVFLRFLECDDSKLSEPREHRLCRENFTFGRENFKVWNLKHSRLRSRKLKFGRGNFDVWHLKHWRLTSSENMFLARSFTGRCNRRYHVKFTSYCKLIECSRPIRFFVVSLMYNNRQ